MATFGLDQNEARSFTQIIHMHYRGPSSVAFPGTLVGSYIRNGAARNEANTPQWDAGITGGNSPYYATVHTRQFS